MNELRLFKYCLFYVVTEFNFHGSIIDVEKLSAQTNITEDKILTCTFYNILNHFCGSSKVERARFMSGMIRNNLHYCPLCILESKYYRIQWKVNQINACTLHKIKLVNQCPDCNKLIKLRDVELIGICPYCNSSLDKISEMNDIIDEELQREEWLYETWIQLFKISQSSILSPNELALKIIYILCGFNDYFERETLENKLKSPSIIPTLLQHARGTLAVERTLHMGFVLEILKDNNIYFNDFIDINVPDLFKDSILNDKQKKTNNVYCFAPWCKSNGIHGSLIKTGTSTRIRKGEKLRYYLTCSDCCCEYAFNTKDELIERSYFFRIYNLINDLTDKEISLSELSQRINESLERLKRSLAYFMSRGIQFNINGYKKEVIINDEIKDNFIQSLKSNGKFNNIKKWECFSDYFHYLVYRYHKDVIGFLITRKQRRKPRMNLEINKYKVEKLLDEMFLNNIDITVGAVCKKINISPETIRNWGCNRIISERKKRQKEERIFIRKNEIYSLIDEMFMSTKEKISSKELYKKIGIGRTVLWRIAPEITSYISELLSQQKRIYN
ncbi:TniQ family protein [Bacillus suaedaesalsae]|uniref:TniQ family protein n=1 Tax=Bacillus suaedaesalsae TaxID=2810349 RepID=A0ABS2DL27_9BACI|nr:TniQ family protein [Bacillus suaedaesalsae]MBM6619202.1 TniQ family protein [Bacillus suaedaesalsae]